MRSISTLIVLLFLLCCPLAVPAEDNGYDIFYEDFTAGVAPGEKPAILYTGRTLLALTMRSKPDKTSESLGVIGEKKTIQIFGYDTQWLFCWSDDVGVYYLQRSKNVDPIEAVDPENTPPYGVIQQRYVAVTAKDAVLRTAPDEGADAIETYPVGTRMSIWLIQDGWAVIPYKRIVGYIYMGDFEGLTPVAPDPQTAQEGDILTTYTTFYSTKTTELNLGRMENIRVGCQYIDQTYQPGFQFTFNSIAGPYSKARGYKDSPVLIDGATVTGSGGGTCQVSTTLYNALLQLPDSLTVLYRRPHGPGGASYAPHGVDAAVGTDYLDLRFRNDFGFPITIDSTAQNGALCICIRKGTYMPEAE